MTRLLLSLAVVSLLALHIAPPSASAAPVSPALTIATGGHGLEFGHVIDDAGQIRFTDAVAQRIVDAGAGWVRINFRLGGFHDWTETSSFGVSALSRYDEIVGIAQSHGLQVVGLLSNEAWHGGLENWQANSAEEHGGTGDNVYLTEFAEQAAVVVIEHFAGRVDLWEVWNEPNAPATYLYPSNFAWLLARVYLAADAAGLHAAEFITGGLSSVQAIDGSLSPLSTGASFLQATYARGSELAGWETIRAQYGTYPFDAVGQHLYVDGYQRTTRENIRGALEIVHAVAVEAARGEEAPPTVVTEVGWGSTHVSERIQADNLQMAFAEIMVTPFVQTASWFFLRDEPSAGLSFGLLRSNGSEKPTWQAYQIVTIPEVPPLAPYGLSVSGFAAGIRLDWQANAAPDLGGYHVYRAMDPAGPFTQLTTDPLADLIFLDADVPLDVPLYYQVVAVDRDGNASVPSPTIGALRSERTGLDPFARTWARTDLPVADELVMRTWMWGVVPITSMMTEQYADAPGGFRQVQYYDKSRMELTDPAGDPNDPWYVTNGLLIVELMSGRMQVGDNVFIERDPAAVNVAGDPGSGPTYAALSPLRYVAARPEGQVITARVDGSGRVTTDASLADYQVKTAKRVAESRHTVAQPFWDLMNASGLVSEGGQEIVAPLFQNPFYATGYPITEAYWTEVLVAGDPLDVLVQCFERRCLTYTPNNPPGWQVEAGNVGRHYYEWRYGQAP